MRRARLSVFFVGLLLPYLARVSGGVDSLVQYTSAGVGGWLLLNGFNAIAWGSILAISYLYRRPVSLVAPSVLGFGYLAWAHYSLDLSADAQSSLGIIFIPIYALLPILVGGGIGYVLDMRVRRAA